MAAIHPLPRSVAAVGQLAGRAALTQGLRSKAVSTSAARPTQALRHRLPTTATAVPLLALTAGRLTRRRKAQVVSALRAVATEAPPESILFREGAGPPAALSDASVADWKGDALVVFLKAKEDDAEVKTADLPAELEDLDGSVGGALSAFLAAEEFEAKPGTAATLPLFGKAGPSRVVFVGLGAAEADARAVGAAAAGAVKGLKGGSVGVAFSEGLDPQALAEGFFLGLHADKRFQGAKTPDKDKAPKGPDSLEMLGFPDGSDEAFTKAAAIASGVIFARELVNAPANIVDPLNLANTAAEMAGRLGLKAEVLDEKECEKLGMGSFLAVSKASNLGARLIHLTYSPGGTAKRKIGIVGKGLTFDSGGYNLKAGGGSMIEMMKFDMGGSASTLGAAAAVAQLKPKDVEVHFVIATCENMVSGNPGALHPGDIITAMDGTTIEVNNTDAEGRLTLADALLFCQEKGVTEVVDIATLTGACMVALGQGITGMWSNSDDLAQRLESAAKQTGEKVWRMPLEDDYFEGLKSDFADMKNTGPRFGGAITAALFLQKFVQKEVRWAHLDIAGPTWSDKPKGVNGIGGTGTMVRTLTDFICKV